MNVVDKLKFQAKVGLFWLPDDFRGVGYGEAASVIQDLLLALNACEPFADKDGFVNGVNIRAAIAKATAST